MQTWIRPYPITTIQSIRESLKKVILPIGNLELKTLWQGKQVKDLLSADNLSSAL